MPGATILWTQNILVDEFFSVRVADFGFSRLKAANMSKGYTSSTMGPIKSMAPEALRYHQYSEASDVFSFGVTLFEIAVGDPPWKVRGIGCVCVCSCVAV